MKKSLFVILVTGCMVWAGAASASLLAVDIQGSGKPVEAGFVEQSSYSQTHSTVAGDVTVTFTGYQGLFDYTTNTGTAHPDLFRDFIFKNGGTITIALTGPGIGASTDYDMTFWSFYGAEARNTTIAPTAGTTGPTLGPIAYTVNPTSLSDNSASGTFTSDGTGTLTLALSGTNSRPALNGFTLDVIPEPASLALLGIGLLARVFVRRRA